MCQYLKGSKEKCEAPDDVTSERMTTVEEPDERHYRDNSNAGLMRANGRELGELQGHGGGNFYPLRIWSDGRCNAYIRGQPSRMAGAKESYERRGRNGRVKRLTRENDRELSEKRGNPKVQ